MKTQHTPKRWKKCCEEQPTIDPETGRCQNGCQPKTVPHTPTPWTKSKVSIDKDEWLKLHNQEQICIGKGTDVIAIVYGPDDQEEANAAFIVRAVNAHEELVSALKLMLGYPGHGKTPEERVAIARQAIAKAEARA